jgi:PTH1 family peptidyl-tRNA hydrolase
MNLSGGPAAELMNYFGVDLDHLIVVHDDIDLSAWQVRLKRGGGEGGHNGLRDISRALGSRDYLRVRLGVDRPTLGDDAAAYVLRDFPSSQLAEVELLASRAADAVEQVISHGLAAAQLVFHSPPAAPKPAGDPPRGGSLTGQGPGSEREES